MSIESQRVKVYELVQNLMAANYPDIPVHWSNIKFEQPDGVFVMVSVILGDEARMDLGEEYTIRQISLLQIDVFTPDDQGTKEMSEIAGFLARSLRETEHKLSDGDRLLIKPAGMSSPTPQRGFARIMLRFPLWRDERVS